MTELIAVYRSTHPDVLAHWGRTGSADAQNQWRERVKQALAELGFPGRNFATNGFNVAGVEHPEDQPIPAGWRRDRKLFGAITPARSTKAGKAIGRQLDELKRPNPSEGLPGGMPDMAFGKATFMQPGIRREGDAVYVSWSGELCEQDTDRIDTGVWERIKLSAYYAAIEEHEGATSDA